MISETKFDDSFPTAQFKGFDTPYRHDRNSKDEGLLLYIREDIPSKRFSCKFNYDIEFPLILEINLKKRNWFLNGSYILNKNQISHHLECLNRILDEHNSEYDHSVFMLNERSIKELCNLNGPKSLINQPTCFKNPEKPTGIDLILTNRPTYFQLSTVLETGLSVF